MREETIFKNEWINHFKLTAKSPTKFYKTAGCFALGFDFPKIYGELQPHFVIYPLWKKDIKDCFSAPLFLHTINNNKGLKYQEPLSKLLEQKETLFADTERYLGFNLMEDIKKEDILRLVDHTWENESTCYLHPQIIRLKSYMATFLNDQKLFDQTVTLMEEFYQDHKEWMDKGYGGATWKESLATVFTNRQAILDKIEENIANSKIKERVKLIG
jgi:hypothetical protein